MATPEQKKELSKNILQILALIVISFYCIDFLFNKDVDRPSEWKKYENCNDTSCYRICYRGIYEEALEEFQKHGKDKWGKLKYELKEMDALFQSKGWFSEFEVECSNIRREEQKLINVKLGTDTRIANYWNNMFGMYYY
jgi:hypothetical protein